MRSLDGTLAPDLRIRLLKLDVSGPAPHAVRAKRAPEPLAPLSRQVQGYECEILKGAARLLQSHRVLALTAEIDQKLLGAHGCNPDALRALIQQVS